MKHHLQFLWRIIELTNDILFSSCYKDNLEKVTNGVLRDLAISPFTFKKLDKSDIIALHKLLTTQSNSDIEYFKPHGFDQNSIKKQMNRRAFLMMGAFDNNCLAGYFFLRFFVNKKCFVGRLIDKNYRGKGIGQTMNAIMYEIAWKMNFRCLSTISRDNSLVMRAHSKNKNMVVLKELQNNFLLVEFVRNQDLLY